MGAALCVFSLCSVMSPAAASQRDSATVLKQLELKLNAALKPFMYVSDYNKFYAMTLGEQEEKIKELKDLVLESSRVLDSFQGLEEKNPYTLQCIKSNIASLQENISRRTLELFRLGHFHSKYQQLFDALDRTVKNKLSPLETLPSLENMTFAFMEEFNTRVEKVRLQMAEDRKRGRSAVNDMGRMESAGYHFTQGAFIRLLLEQEDLRIMLENLVSGPLDVADEKIKRTLGDAFHRAETSFQRIASTAEGRAGSIIRDARSLTECAREEVVTVMKQAVAWGTLAATTLGFLSLGFYSAYRFIGKGINAIDKPTVVEETNIRSYKKGFGASVGLQDPDPHEVLYPLFSDIIFDEQVGQELSVLKFSINSINNGNRILKNILLSGNPGTGKTMIARALAHETDCYWMYLPVSSLFKIEKVSDVLKQVDELFIFAENQKKPVIIIFDNAELFFESSQKMTEDTRKIIMHIMQKMSVESKKYMVVAITHKQPEVNESMASCFPERIYVKLPPLELRKELLKKYVERNFKDSERAVFDTELLMSIALKTKGYSPKALIDFLGSIRSMLGASGSQQLTKEFVNCCLQKCLEKHVKGFIQEIVAS